MLKNPWAISNYKGKWNQNDPLWDDYLASQIPFGIDPRNSYQYGIFFMQSSNFIDSTCIADFQIGHQRSSDNYKDTWYDAEDIDD